MAAKKATKKRYREVKKFTVKRSEWFRGGMVDDEGIPISSKLLSPDNGRMCCLGFHAIACGASKRAIEGKEYPACVKQRYSRLCDGELYECMRKIASTNDSVAITDKQREAKLKRKFKALGITVTFED